jgi:serine/threonine protein phosphatase PrpC
MQYSMGMMVAPLLPSLPKS